MKSKDDQSIFRGFTRGEIIKELVDHKGYLKKRLINLSDDALATIFDIEFKHEEYV